MSAIPANQPDNRIRTLLSMIVNRLMSPLGYDSALNRHRQTTVVETLPTLANVTTVANIVTLGGDQAQVLTRGANLTAWALNMRTRIT